MTVTSIATFTITVPFSQWAAEFDGPLAAERHAEFGIKPLYRGISKQDPATIVVIHRHPEGAAARFIEKYGEWIASHGVVLDSAQISEWLDA
jgi:hypothetical protein